MGNGTIALTNVGRHAPPPAPNPALPRLDQVFDEYAEFMWRSMRRLGVPDAALEDAVQDAFIVVHRRLADYDERGSLRSWLFAIARRVASDYRRSAKRERERRVDGVTGEAPTIAPDENVARNQAANLVRDFIRGLDEERRLVFVLMDIEGLSAPEVSSALDIKLNTVYSRLRRTRAMFEQVLTRHRVGEERRKSWMS